MCKGYITEKSMQKKKRNQEIYVEKEYNRKIYVEMKHNLKIYRFEDEIETNE